MHNHIKFSVIIPFYNSAKYITKCLESILNQSYKNFEVLAINDGSTDKSETIIKKVAGDDKRIKIYRKKNGGYVSAVNYALGKVTGDYFILLGSDDSLNTSLFKKIAMAANNKKPDIVGFKAMKVINGAKKIDETSNISQKIELFNSDPIRLFKKYPKDTTIFTTRDTAKCFKTSLLKELRYFGRYGYDADGIFTLLFLHRCRSFMCLPIEGYYWTIRRDSLSGRDIAFTTNIDRIGNWVAFYSSLLEKEYTLVPMERWYLRYFFNILLDASRQKIVWPYQNYQLFKAAKQIFRKFNKHLKLSKKHKMYLVMPFVYILLSRTKEKIKTR